jgi:hypothetical protein
MACWKIRVAPFLLAIAPALAGMTVQLFDPRRGAFELGWIEAQYYVNSVFIAPECVAPAIQMCDALSRNTSGEFETIVAHCLAHGRRQFVEVADNFPGECRHVLETLRDVYRNDALARPRAEDVRGRAPRVPSGAERSAHGRSGDLVP